MSHAPANTIAIIGGGLAGLAAAVRLREHGWQVELFEARRALGGRAASYRDPTTGELIDHCQHVSMACCTNFQDFCERTGIAEQFQRYRTLHFFAATGKRYDLRASRWLPAPLHLAPALLRQGYLTWRERLRIGSLLLQLARTSAVETTTSPSIGQWLRDHGSTKNAIDRFWSVVLVSALGETVDNASLAAARKVFVDGFVVNRHGYEVDVPLRSLRELFDEQVAARLQQQGVNIHRQTPLQQLHGDASGVTHLELAAGEQRRFDRYLLAVPWRQAYELLSPDLQAAASELAPAATFSSSPISGVHLWFDRPLTTLPHAVLIDRLTQWVFRREPSTTGHAAQHYYQVVISASRDLSQLPQASIIATVIADLQAVFPDAREAQLLASRIVTEREAVFSYRPGLDALRPRQQTAVANLLVAGDWTRTDWPATMESAVRSGYLAAQAIVSTPTEQQQLLVLDLPRGWLAKITVG
ncbi:MAG TPA: hydroxysqualene dehydroxylase HpnE, partial [Pirellulaceae bacterium]|nr:hydroxysqualene dehydroxylase HpnE [Pirellulaceae bacterium]